MDGNLAERPESHLNDVSSLARPPTRSELLLRRKEETIRVMQGQYDVWQARQITQPVATKTVAQSRNDGAGPRSKSQLALERKKKNLVDSISGSGFDPATQAALLHDSQDVELCTSISRPTIEPTIAWIDEPVHSTCAQLLEARRQSTLNSVLKAAAQPKRSMNSRERADYRVDLAVKLLSSAEPGKSRQELLARRKNERASSNEEMHMSSQRDQPPRFSSQEEPFWTLDARETHDRNKGSTQSLEVLKEQRKWYAAPGAYPRANQRIDNGAQKPDAFKVASNNLQSPLKYLDNKLTSGPKRSMRGYPPEGIKIAAKLTDMPAPALPLHSDTNVQGGFRSFTDTAFKFKYRPEDWQAMELEKLIKLNPDALEHRSDGSARLGG